MCKNKSSCAKAIMIFVMIFALGAVLGLTAYMLTLKGSPDVPINPNPDSSINPNPSDNPEIDMSDWKTYSNNEFGFEVKFPSDLVLQKNTGEAYISFSGELSGKSYFLNFGYIPQSTLDTRGISYCELYPNDSRCEEFKSNNLRFLIDWNVETEGAFTASKAEIPKPEGGKIVISILHSPNQDIKVFFRQILSTFKFIEKDETADWKTYRNEEYGFEFKYPQDWFINSKSSTHISIVNNKYKDSEGEFPYINVSIYNNEKNLSLRNWFYENQSFFFGTIKPFEGKDYQLKDTKIQDSNAIEFSYSRIVKNTLVDVDSNIISIGAINSGENYDKILSTFKFTIK